MQNCASACDSRNILCGRGVSPVRIRQPFCREALSLRFIREAKASAPIAEVAAPVPGLDGAPAFLVEPGQPRPRQTSLDLKIGLTGEVMPHNSKRIAVQFHESVRHQWLGKVATELHGVDEIAPSETSRLSDQAVQPFKTRLLHPPRRAWHRSPDEIKGDTHPDANRYLEIFQMEFR